MKRKRPKNVFLGHLNINSIKNKFESVWELIKDTFDIFLLSESKLDSSFPDDQFSIPGYRIVRKDRDRNGGGLLLYINEDIPFKIIQNSSLPPTLEVLPIEINLGRFKFLLIGLYKPPSVSEKEFLLHLNKAHNFFSTKYENITLIGDFNMQPGNKNLKDFRDLNQLEHLILKPTCYKGKTPSTIDLIITNHKTSFMKSDTCETGLSDHHKMVHSFLRKTFAKGKPKTIYYRCFKNFEQNKFNEELKKRISIDLSFEAFLEIFQSTLDRFAPYKQKKYGITTILS